MEYDMVHTVGAYLRNIHSDPNTKKATENKTKSVKNIEVKNDHEENPRKNSSEKMSPKSVLSSKNITSAFKRFVHIRKSYFRQRILLTAYILGIFI